MDQGSSIIALREGWTGESRRQIATRQPQDPRLKLVDSLYRAERAVADVIRTSELYYLQIEKTRQRRK